MKSNTKQVRDTVKNLIIEKGANNILNRHITEVVERIGCTYCDVQNAMRNTERTEEHISSNV